MKNCFYHMSHKTISECDYISGVEQSVCGCGSDKYFVKRHTKNKSMWSLCAMLKLGCSSADWGD